MSLSAPSSGRTYATGEVTVGDGQPCPFAADSAGIVAAVPTEVDGAVCSVAFSDGAWPSHTVVTVTPANAAAAKAGLYVTTSSTDFTVHAVNAEPGTAVVFHYQVIGAAP